MPPKRRARAKKSSVHQTPKATAPILNETPATVVTAPTIESPPQTTQQPLAIVPLSVIGSQDDALKLHAEEVLNVIIKQSHSDLSSTVEKIQNLENSLALRVLLAVVFALAGVPDMFLDETTAHDVSHASTVLDHAASIVMSQRSPPPLMHPSSPLRLCSSIFTQFFEALVTPNGFSEDQSWPPPLVEWLSQLASSRVRPFRHVAVLGLGGLLRGFIQQLVSGGSDSFFFSRMDDLSERLFVQRCKDVCPLVRQVTFRLLRSSFASLPEHFLRGDRFIRLLSIALFDRRSEIRREGFETLFEILLRPGSVLAHHNFVHYFRSSLAQATGDVETRIAVTALHILALFVSGNSDSVLEPSLLDRALFSLLDDRAVVRAAAGRLLTRCLLQVPQRKRKRGRGASEMLGARETFEALCRFTHALHSPQSPETRLEQLELYLVHALWPQYSDNRMGAIPLCFSEASAVAEFIFTLVQQDNKSQKGLLSTAVRLGCAFLSHVRQRSGDMDKESSEFDVGPAMRDNIRHGPPSDALRKALGFEPAVRLTPDDLQSMVSNDWSRCFFADTSSSTPQLMTLLLQFTKEDDQENKLALAVSKLVGQLDPAFLNTKEVRQMVKQLQEVATFIQTSSTSSSLSFATVSSIGQTLSNLAHRSESASQVYQAALEQLCGSVRKTFARPMSQSSSLLCIPLLRLLDGQDSSKALSTLQEASELIGKFDAGLKEAKEQVFAARAIIKHVGWAASKCMTATLSEEDGQVSVEHSSLRVSLITELTGITRILLMLAFKFMDASKETPCLVTASQCLVHVADWCLLPDAQPIREVLNPNPSQSFVMLVEKLIAIHEDVAAQHKALVSSMVSSHQGNDMLLQVRVMRLRQELTWMEASLTRVVFSLARLVVLHRLEDTEATGLFLLWPRVASVKPAAELIKNLFHLVRDRTPEANLECSLIDEASRLWAEHDSELMQVGQKLASLHFGPAARHAVMDLVVRHGVERSQQYVDEQCASLVIVTPYAQRLRVGTATTLVQWVSQQNLPVESSRVVNFCTVLRRAARLATNSQETPAITAEMEPRQTPVATVLAATSKKRPRSTPPSSQQQVNQRLIRLLQEPLALSTPAEDESNQVIVESFPESSNQPTLQFLDGSLTWPGEEMASENLVVDDSNMFLDDESVIMKTEEFAQGYAE